MHVWGKAKYEKSLYLFPSFIVKIFIALKKSLQKNNNNKTMYNL